MITELNKHEQMDMARFVEKADDFLTVLFANAELNYSGEELRFQNTTELHAIARFCFPGLYNMTLKSLQMEKAEKEANEQ